MNVHEQSETRLEAVSILRRVEKHAEALNVAEKLADKYGSAVNAIIEMLRESPTYQATLTSLKGSKGR